MTGATAEPGPAADRAIRASRTPEASWVQWLAELRPAALEPVTTRLVVVAPHPDDELLGCGGLMRAQVERGGALCVIAVTDGEASHAGDERWSPAALAAERRAESVRGLRELGVATADTVRLGLPDGEVASRGDDLATALRGLIRPDDVVITTWRFDGHPDHEATGRQVARVAHACSGRLLEVPVWMWHWSWPDDARIPWQRMRALPLDAAAQAAKQRAIDQHATQMEQRCGGAVGPVLDDAILARARRASEYFFV